jgi:ribonuclease HI
MNALYCDGGVIGPNPSPLGGTFAWVLTRDGEALEEQSGVLLPSNIGQAVVTNNNSELYALLVGLETLPEGWSGRVNSDSQTALGWVFKGWNQAKIPNALRDRLNDLIASGKLLFLDSLLLQGHPTKEDLARGMGAKRNLPVSKWNVRCDDLCTEEANRYRDRLPSKPTLTKNGIPQLGYPLRDCFNGLAERLHLPVTLAREQYGLTSSDDYPRVIAAMEADVEASR